jgi:hypothetical protein
MRSATPSSEKAQIDSLVDEVLTLSVDFQKKVTGAIK